MWALMSVGLKAATAKTPNSKITCELVYKHTNAYATQEAHNMEPKGLDCVFM